MGSRATGAAIRRYLHGEEEAAVAWSRPEDGLEQATKEAAPVMGLPGTSTRATAGRWAWSIEDDVETAGLTFSNWHEKANEENKLEWKNRIKKLGELRKKLSGMTKKKKKKEKTDELRK